MIKEFITTFSPDLKRLFVCLILSIVLYPLGFKQDPRIEKYGFPFLWLYVYEGSGVYYVYYVILWEKLAISLFFLYILSCVFLFIHSKLSNKSEELKNFPLGKSQIALSVFRGIMWGVFAIVSTGLIVPVIAILYSRSDPDFSFLYHFIWPPFWLKIGIWLFLTLSIPHIVACIAMGVLTYQIKKFNVKIKYINLWCGLLLGSMICCVGLIKFIIFESGVPTHPTIYFYSSILVFIIWMIMIYGWIGWKILEK